MRIRHLVGADNLDHEGFIVDPLLVRHGIVVAGRIADLAAPIDPLTHLNLDFPEHRIDDCLVAERLERGAVLLREDQQFCMACPRPNAYTRRGHVDRDRQRAAWQKVGVRDQ